MHHLHSTVAVFESHDDAEAAVRRLAQSGYPIAQLSIIGRGYHSEQEVLGFYNMGDRVRLWGKNGALWGGLWGLLSTGAFMAVPVIGPVVVLGHLAGIVAGALEGAAILGGLGAIGGALASIGVPKDSVLRYQQALRAEKYVVVVHGTAEEAHRAHELLAASKPLSVETHEAKAGGAAPTSGAVAADSDSAHHHAT